MDMKSKATFSKNGLLGKLAVKLKENKKLELFVYIGIAVVVVVLYLSTLTPNDAERQNDEITLHSVTTTQSEQEVEARLKKVLSSIRGAGAVEVMITYDTGVELIPAMSENSSSNRSESSSNDGRQSLSIQENETTQPATISGSGGNQPIVLTEKQPTVRGVIVIAEGAADISVRFNLQKAVQTVLNVSAANVEVFELSKDKNIS